MSKPTFSIIVPVYNVEKYLNQCVDSVLNQTYQDYELILVDDGSPDACPKICDDFAKKDKRIKVIHKENGGQTSARKVGAISAIGEYVVCLDADDWISLDYLERFYSVIKEYSPDMICCGYYLSKDGENVENHLPENCRYYDKQAIVDKIFPKLIQAKNATYFTPSVWAKAYKRELYLKHQTMIDERIRIGEDSVLVISITAEINSLYVLNDCLYYYRVNTQSITKDRKPFLWNGPKLIAENLAKTVDLSVSDFKEQLYRKIVHELFSVVVSRFYQDKPLKEIKKEIKEQLKQPVYAESIKLARFKGSLKAKFMSIALKRNCFSIIKLYSKVK